MSIQHVVIGTSVPRDPPPSIGAHYINENTGAHWLASGTQSPDDWQPCLLMRQGYGAPVDPPTGPGLYCQTSSPFGVWVAVFKSREYWDWVRLAIVEEG